MFCVNCFVVFIFEEQTEIYMNVHSVKNVLQSAN